jgi:hypothetical protein
MSEPLRAEEYSLAREVRLLRDLIDKADNAGLKANLTKVLASCLFQDEARSIRESELLSREAVGMYADLLSQIVGNILREELAEPDFWRVMDRIQSAITGTPLPENSVSAQRRLLGR